MANVSLTNRDNVLPAEASIRSSFKDYMIVGPTITVRCLCNVLDFYMPI
jgi:hypothetical protein